MVLNPIAAAQKRIYASVIHAKQMSLSVTLSVSRAEALIFARFVKPALRQSSQILKLLTSMTLECLEENPPQNSEVPQISYNKSIHLDIIFSHLLPILRSFETSSRTGRQKLFF